MLGLEVKDEPPHRAREPSAARRFRGEKAFHALFLEAANLAVERTLGSAGLSRPLRHRVPEQRERAYLLVSALLGPQAKQCELLPVVGRLDASSALRPAHTRSPLAPWLRGRRLSFAAGTEACHTSASHASSGRRLGLPTNRRPYCQSDSLYGSRGLWRDLPRTPLNRVERGGEWDETPPIPRPAARGRRPGCQRPPVAARRASYTRSPQQTGQTPRP